MNVSKCPKQGFGQREGFDIGEFEVYFIFMPNEEDCNYLNDRIKKVTNALYKVTDFLPDREPVKWVLRDTGINILMNSVSVEEEKSSPKKVDAMREILHSLRKIINALELAGSSGFISEINFEILKREYQKIEEALRSTEKSSDQVIFSEDILPDPALTSDVEESEANDFASGRNDGSTSDVVYKGHSIGHQKDIIDKGHSLDQSVGKFARQEDERKESNTNSIQKIKKGVKKNRRTEQIVLFLRKNGWSTIRDVLSQFPGVNQKTIQRDLLHLMDEGVLKKEGDKRWRKYDLQD